jgi:mannose-1-phosphate guanylyltransferase
MKAFLLAAGNGTRLRPITNTIPKCLLPIRGLPLLGIWLEMCRRFGIHEVLINVHAHTTAVREYIEKTDHEVTVKLFEEPTLLGSAGTLAANREWVSRENMFWVLYADVLTNVNLGSMRDYHLTRKTPVTIAVYQVPDPTRCGVVVLDANNVVTEFVEKPDKPKSNLAFSGVMLASPRLFEFIPERRPADIGFDVLPGLVGQMSAHESCEYFQDIGTLDNYSIAQTSWPAFSESRE